MRAMRAEKFSGYEALKLVELPKPELTDGKVLVRMTAAGVTPLDHTILSGKFPHDLKAPLVLGNEGAGVVEEGGGTDFPVGSRVMFFGPYGAFEDGTYSEWLAVRKQDLCLIPDNVNDVSAAGIPVAYLTAQVALTRAGFRTGKTVLAPAIGGSIGNAVTQLARANCVTALPIDPPIAGASTVLPVRKPARVRATCAVRYATGMPAALTSLTLSGIRQRSCFRTASHSL